MIYVARPGSGLTLGLTGCDTFKMICRPNRELPQSSPRGTALTKV